jgi:hypothetical protein
MVALACSLGLGSLLLLSDPRSLPDSTSVPLELTDGGRAIVAVALNGRPYRLAVETGSPNVRITSAAVRDLGLREAGMEHGDPVFRLDSLRIGGILVRGLAVARGDEVARLGVDGVLGLDAYADYLLTLDYPGARLALSRDTLPEPDGREVLRAVRVGPFVGVALDVGGIEELGVVDTQGGIGFQAVPEVADRLVFESPLQVVGRAVVGGGEPVEVKRARLGSEIRIGRHAFVRPRMAVHRLPPEIPARMTVGPHALRHFAVALDQRSMRVRFTRTDPAPISE